MVWTDCCRIYRSGFTQAHDLDIMPIETDIYGEDKWGLLVPDTDALIMPDEFGVVRTPGVLLLPAALDVGVGYVIFIYESMVINGQRLPVTTTLDTDVVVGETQYPVVSDNGFVSGRNVIIIDGDTHQWGRVWTVADDVLTVYDEYAVTVAFSAGAVVSAGSYYSVVGKKGPSRGRGIQRIIVEEIPFKAA